MQCLQVFSGALAATRSNDGARACMAASILYV
jgi:hypothetical protein